MTPEPQPVEFRLSDPLTLRGDAWGPERGTPVVLQHGGGQTRHSWSGAGRSIGAAGFRAIALDLRGHGESDWAPGGRYFPEDFVADLKGVVAALARPPVLVGASLGGMTGLLAAGESEEPLLAGLVLVDVAPRIEARGVARIIDFMLARPEGFASLEDAADAVAGYRLHRGRPKDLSGLRKNLRKAEDGRWRWHWDPAFIGHGRTQDVEQLRRLATGRDAPEGGVAEGRAGARFNDPERLLAAAGRLRIPAMLVRDRESDVVSQRGVEEFLAAAAHAEFVDVSNAGHMLAGDRNDAFNEAVLGFLREAGF